MRIKSEQNLAQIKEERYSMITGFHLKFTRQINKFGR